MKADDLIYRSIYIITEYYKNNLKPYFESISDDILWIGPSQRQQLKGREAIIQTWAAEKHTLTFTMGDISVQCVSPHSHVREILLHYDIYTHYPSGNTYMHDQRLHYTWREKRVKTDSGWEYRSEIVMIHISNAWKYDSRDTIYPIHYETVYEPEHFPAKNTRYVTVKAADMSVHRIAANHILYIETIKHSAKLRIHTKNDTITINGTLPVFEEKYPGLFLRIHASYLINPAHVREIRRFSVSLTDGTELPIPEKKYTRIKKLLLQEDRQDS